MGFTVFDTPRVWRRWGNANIFRTTEVLIFLLSLLVAQLNQASESRYDEMFGFARLHLSSNQKSEARR